MREVQQTKFKVKKKIKVLKYEKLTQIFMAAPFAEPPDTTFSKSFLKKMSRKKF